MPQLPPMRRRVSSTCRNRRSSGAAWAIAIYLWATSLKGVSSMKLHRNLNITQKSACFLAQRLREAWSGMGGDMAGPVEVDETFVGGKAKNMHTVDLERRITGRGGIESFWALARSRRPQSFVRPPHGPWPSYL